LKKYIHLFFDLDRTLWDFDRNANEALGDVFEKYSLHNYFSEAGDFIDTYHRHNEELWSQYRVGNLKKEILRSKRFELTLREKQLEDPALARRIGDEYLELSVLKTRLFPYAIEILEYLKPKYRLYIITNGFRETQLKKLKNCGLDVYFEKVFTSETIGFNKPDIRIFQWAVNSLNAKKHDCLMIGDDNEVDIAGAESYGIDSVYFNPGKIPGSAVPTYEIMDLRELERIL
jgi:putative hydrolase of the HAD superfamily